VFFLQESIISSRIQPLNNKKGAYVSKKYTPNPKDKYEKAEYELLRAMLQDHGIRKNVFEKIDETFFSREKHNLIEFINKNDKEGDDLVNGFENNDDTRKIVTKMLVEEHAPLDIKIIDEYIGVLKKRKEELERSQLREALIDADKNNNEGEALEIMSKLASIGDNK